MSLNATTAAADLMTHLRARVQAPGVLGAAARHHLASPGKQIRGRLALGLGPRHEPERAFSLRLALACELLHNASLVHDDIQDRDALRRGRASVWQRFGTAIAISLGDHFLVQAFGEVAALASVRPELATLFTEATTTVIRGQTDELVCRGETNLTPTTYERMAAGKTGAMLALPIAGAALLHGLDTTAVAGCRRAADLLGIAFQIMDDVADLRGRKGRGEAGADLVEGKVTWPMIAYLAQCTPGRRRDFAEMIAVERRRIVEAAQWVADITGSDAMERAGRRCRHLVRRAYHVLERDLPEEFTRTLSGLLDPLVSPRLQRLAPTAGATLSA